MREREREKQAEWERKRHAWEIRFSCIFFLSSVKNYLLFFTVVRSRRKTIQGRFLSIYLSRYTFRPSPSQLLLCIYETPTTTMPETERESVYVREKEEEGQKYITLLFEKS